MFILQRRFFALAVFFLAATVMAPTQGWAGNQIISAPVAFSKAKAGSVILLDIRTPQEWKQTGIGQGAFPVSIDQQDFLQKLDSLTGGDKTKTIAVICATGSRSRWLQQQLKSRGYSSIIDVSEGMVGNRRGPGWIKRGLPVVKWTR